MSDTVLVALLAVILNTVVVGGTGFAFVIRLGTRLDALAEAVTSLTATVAQLRSELFSIDRRLSHLEGKVEAAGRGQT